MTLSRLHRHDSCDPNRKGQSVAGMHCLLHHTVKENKDDAGCDSSRYVYFNESLIGEVCQLDG